MYFSSSISQFGLPSTLTPRKIKAHLEMFINLLQINKLAFQSIKQSISHATESHNLSQPKSTDVTKFLELQGQGPDPDTTTGFSQADYML